MKVRTTEYFIREAFSSLRHNGLMSIASVSTVALSLLILGMFLIMVLNLNHMIPGVVQVTFVDKDQALARFKQRLGEQQGLLAVLGDTNPLPNAFEVKVDKPERVKPAAQAVAQLKGVENARFGQEIIEQLFTLTKMVRLIGLALIVFLALAALFIISNTIRITVFARRKEIGIMKYVGATDAFIRWPFLIEGMILGFSGAVIAVVLLIEAYTLLTGQIYQKLVFLPLIPKYPFLTYVSILLIVAGTVIGALGSTISLKRFMKV